jgi:plasmid stabilization system protein ParE
MPFKVTISSRAEANLDVIIAYLESEWPLKVKVNFINALKEKIRFISQNPLMYQASKKRKLIRRCIINQHNVMYYKIKKNEVEIITIQDTRSNPKSVLS